MLDHATDQDEAMIPIRIVWPPPGLESSQGIFWRTAGGLGTGGSLLVIPSLLSVTIPQPLHSMGLFGSSWWLLGLTSLLGLLIVLITLGGLLGFLRTARRAALRGIDLETVLQVSADHDGEMGSLIQGTRSFSSLDEGRRIRAVRARIWASLLFLSASIWLMVGWFLSLFLAGRGLLDPTGVWALTMGPTALVLLAGAVSKGVEGTAIQGAFQPFFWFPGRNDGQRKAAEIWGEELQRFRKRQGEKGTSGRRTFLAGVLSVFGLATAVTIPAASLAVASSVGPTLASMAVPSFTGTAKKAGEMEALRPLRLPPKVGISPMAAGEALHSIASAGGKNSSPEFFKDPPRRFEESFLPAQWQDQIRVRPYKWPEELFPMIQEGLSPEEERFLREIGTHPGLEEFNTIAFAGGIDVLGARYPLPFSEEASYLSLPIPRLTPVREAGIAMVARSAIQFLDGDLEGAERTLRILLSAGLLIGDDSPVLIDGIIGFGLATYAGDALEGFLEASGRQAEAAELRGIRGAVERAARKVGQGALRASTDKALEGMSSGVTAEGVVRGVRWEYLGLLAGLSPCTNPHQMVFGPENTLTTFLRSARAELVRYPSEGEFFRIMERGWIGSPSNRSGGIEGALFGMVEASLGEGPGNCLGLLNLGVF